MSKNLKIIEIVLWTIIAIILVLFLINTTKKDDSNFRLFNIKSFGEAKAQYEETASLEGIENIQINTTSYDILVVHSLDEKIKIVQSSSTSLKDEDRFTLRKNGNILVIEEKKNLSFGLFNIGRLNNKLEIFIPKNYEAGLKFNSTSGDIKIDGDYKWSNLKSNQVSGDFKINSNMTLGEISLLTTSGEIEINKLITKEYELRSVSGDIKIEEISGSGEGKTTSGEIEIGIKKIDKYARYSSVSGDVSLEIIDDISFEFDGNSVSGDISSNLPISFNGNREKSAHIEVGKSPFKEIIINTTSGDIKIRK